MKKSLLLFAIVIGFSVAAKAQSATYHNFKVDIGIGYAIPSESSGTNGTKAGVTFTVQPHYRLSDDLAVGLRFEGAALGDKNENDGGNHVKISVLVSYCATGEYYFTQKGIRPFVGAGLGIFTQSASLDSDSGDKLASANSSKFGFFPEAGIEAGHFRLSADYDILGNNSSYFSIKIGAFFGGGSRK
jgi:outer membrane protein X